MNSVRRGKVRDGGIVFEEPLSLPEGTEVIVHVATRETVGPPDTATGLAAFAALPFFGMWADREGVGDSADWVRRERQAWQQRATRPD